jgi:signal transduction histidine kinase
MTTFLGVPVRVQGRAIGRLYLTDKRDRVPFSVDDEQLVEAFARHAGLAIHNARMHEELRGLAVLKERERIALDLHDGSIQSLYAVSLELEDALAEVHARPAAAAERIDHAIDAIHVTIREIREFITGLDGQVPASQELIAAITALTDDLDRRTSISIKTTGDTAIALKPEASGQLLQLTREALSNVARHANASSVEVAVVHRGDRLRLEVTDDGGGFDTKRPPQGGHHGLANMRARARSLGGSLTIDSDGGGTRVIFEMPFVDGHTGKESSP